MHRITNAIYELWLCLFLRKGAVQESPLLHPERLDVLKSYLDIHFKSSDESYCIPFASTVYWEGLDYLQREGWLIQLEAIDDDLFYVISAAAYKTKCGMRAQ